jgi:hypothetical protein
LMYGRNIRSCLICVRYIRAYHFVSALDPALIDQTCHGVHFRRTRPFPDFRWTLILTIRVSNKCQFPPLSWLNGRETLR